MKIYNVRISVIRTIRVIRVIRVPKASPWDNSWPIILVF